VNVSLYSELYANTVCAIAIKFIFSDCVEVAEHSVKHLHCQMAQC